jgi:NADP-dependent 3-hydroxy acid dehydrogenase YdfG
MDLRAKVAVVSGVTSGIGAALVTRLLAEGATVAGIGRDSERLKTAASGWGARFVPIEADLGTPSAREDAARAIAARFDKVDVLVNNAAACVYESPLEFSGEKWRELFEVNLFATIDLTRALVPRMRGSGHIVNTSSVTARFLANPRFAPYALTKRAVEEWHHALRLELETTAIKTTLIAPGLVDTPIYDKVPSFASSRAKIRERIPQWLTAEDVADAIVWALARPDHVVVAELVLLPRGQAR